MKRWYRREFLAGSGLALTSMIAGCSTAAVDESGGATGGSSVDGIELPSVPAEGSPKGTIGIRPSGKVVLLDFFATWCAPCKPEMANLRAARDRFSREDVFMVSITQETDTGAIKQFWERYEGTWPVVMDPDLEATQKYNVTGIPTIIVLTPDGAQVMRHTGLAGEKKIIGKLEEALERAETV